MKFRKVTFIAGPLTNSAIGRVALDAVIVFLPILHIYDGFWSGPQPTSQT